MQLLAKILVVGLLLAMALPSLRSACRARTLRETGQHSSFGDPEPSPSAEAELDRSIVVPGASHWAEPSPVGGTHEAEDHLRGWAAPDGGANHEGGPGPTERLRVAISDCRHDRGVVTLETGRGTLVLEGDAFFAPGEPPDEPQRHRRVAAVLQDLVHAMEESDLVCLELAGTMVVRIWPCAEFDR